MRIIAGALGGRTFDSPHSFKTHPMSDKMRGALFNILGDIAGLTVLDAFAGSGALGFEAISRGAASVVAIDSDKAAQRVIAANSRTLGASRQLSLIKASANAWLQTNADARFDLVLCDPPYNDVQIHLLMRLASCVKPGGLLVLSWPGGRPAPEFDGLQKVLHRSYGDAGLVFFERAYSR